MTNDELKRSFKLLKAGDEEAFAEIYEELKTPVMTIIYRITRDMELSEDILQELFVKLYLSPPSDSVANPRAYIFRMARNLAIDSIRKSSGETCIDKGDILNIHNEDPWDEYTDKLDVENALGKLSLEARQIVTLKINAGLKFREIAEILDEPAGTVAWRYHKAIASLRNIVNGGRI